MPRIQIGYIATAHGVQGLVKIKSLAEDPACFSKYGDVFTDEKGGNILKITIKQQTPKHLIARIEGINDCNAAEALRGTGLWLDRDSLPDADDDEIYYDDLIGMQVIDQDNAPVGSVIDVVNYGASDLLDVKPIEGGDSFYLPYSDDCVLSVSPDTRIIQIDRDFIVR
jgi:16S rRNA processing protein RimM